MNLSVGKTLYIWKLEQQFIKRARTFYWLRLLELLVHLFFFFFTIGDIVYLWCHLNKVATSYI